MSDPVPRRIPVWVIVPPRTLLLDVAGPIEVLRRANIEQHDVGFEVRYAGVSAMVSTSIGLRLADIEPLPEQIDDDALVVLPGTADMIAFADDAPDAEIEREEAALVAWLRAHVRAEHTLVSICSGALLAARAGLLDGHDCTTHYTCCAELAALAPRATVLENRLYVEDGTRYSSAGVTAGTDLMLHMVSRLCSPVVALAVARHLVVYLRRSGRRGSKGAITSIPPCIARRMRSPRILRARGRWIRSRASRTRVRAICRGSSTNAPA